MRIDLAGVEQFGEQLARSRSAGRKAGRRRGFTADGASTAEPHGVCIGRGTAAGGRRAGEMERGRAAREMGGRDGGTEDGTAAVFGAPTRPCGLKVAIRVEAGACAGGSSSASSLRGADLRGDVAVHLGCRDDGGARGGCAGSESCSGATTRARRRGGACVQRVGGSSPSTTRPELARAGGRVAVPWKAGSGGLSPKGV
jgi:hypothetical protein